MLFYIIYSTMRVMMYGICVLLGGPPDGQRGGGTAGAISTVEKRRPCWQGAEEASAESTKNPG